MGMQSTPPLAISGASGQLGRLIIDDLLARGISPADIIAITRNPGKLADLAERGVVVRAGDFDRPGAELDQAFAGAGRALIISTTPEAPYVEGKRFRQQQAGIDAACAAGVPHIYYTSAPNPAPPTPAIWKNDHFKTEQYLQGLDVKWTILRHNEWPDWHLDFNWRPAIASGVYVTGAGDGRIAHITREDTAAADAGALLAANTAGKIFDITGPAALGVGDIFGSIENITGREIQIRQVEPGELGGHLLQSGLEPLFVPIFEMIAEAIRFGKYDNASPHAAEFAGRPLTTMHDYLAANLKRNADERD